MNRVAISLSMSVALVTLAHGQTPATATALREGAVCYSAANTIAGERCNATNFEFPQEVGAASESNRVELRTRANTRVWVLRTEIEFARPTIARRMGALAGSSGGAGAEREAEAGDGAAASEIAPMRVQPTQRTQRTSVEESLRSFQVTPIADREPLRCTRSLGTLVVQNGPSEEGWRAYNLEPPAELVRTIVAQSGCFTVVERSAEVNALMRERELNGASYGTRAGVQIVDYLMVAGVTAPREEGVARNALIGRAVGGNAFAAETSLSVISTRTSETLASAEGVGRAHDILTRPIILGESGDYRDTPAGQMVTASFLDAYRRMVIEIAGPDIVQADRYRTTETTRMRARANGGATLRRLPPGSTLEPTGEIDRFWWRVRDESGVEGWVDSRRLTPSS